MAAEAPQARSMQTVERPVSLLYRLTLLLVLGGSAAAVVYGGYRFSFGEVGWYHFIMWFVFYVPIAFGITGGYHRLFVHQSYEPKPWLKWIIAFLGHLGLQGGIGIWGPNHIAHHAHSDSDDDLHSPYKYRNLFKGFLYAHVLWNFIDKAANPQKYGKHIRDDQMLQAFTRNFGRIAILSFVLPALVGGLLGPLFGYSLIAGAVDGFIWGGLVRIFFVHHVTWCINSVCHIWGRRPYHTAGEDQSHDFLPPRLTKADPWWRWLFQPVYWAFAIALLILSLGESGHNTHHAQPQHVQHSKFDITWWIIKLFIRLGWAKNPVRRDAALAKMAVV